MGESMSTQKWRDPGPNDWTTEKELRLKMSMKDLQKKNRKAHILLCGPTNAGKSSLMNTLFSICKGRPVFKSSSGSTNMDDVTLTKKCKRLNLPDIFNNCCIIDTPGIQEHTSKDLDTGDITALLKSVIKENYTFPDEKSPLYFRTPTEKVYCLVFVIDAITLDTFRARKTNENQDENAIKKNHSAETKMTNDKNDDKSSTGQTSDQTLDKIRDITQVMNLKGISIVLLLTKIDRLDEDVGANIKKMHESAKVEKAVKEASKIFGVDECNIFPIINFVKDIEIKPLASIPHLLAMRHILGFARDCPIINGADAHP